MTRNRSMLASEEEIYKIMYLSLRNAAQKWTIPIKDWRAALNQFAVFFGRVGSAPMNFIYTKLLTGSQY
jgi:putative transposase